MLVCEELRYTVVALAARVGRPFWSARVTKTHGYVPPSAGSVVGAI
jgi:hypothetical protein